MFQTLYKSENIKYEELKGRAELPKFQRELVWSKNDKLLFLDSVSKGYPFGSLLISKSNEPGEENWIVIDGLQRLTTLKDFEKNPEIYMPVDDYVSEVMDIIKEYAGELEEPEKIELERKLKKTIIQAIGTDVESNTFLKEVVDHLNQLNIKVETGLLDDAALDFLLQLYNFVEKLHPKSYIDLNDLKIPTIFYEGRLGSLPEVFENLNKSGRKLNKYQVYAAQWEKCRIDLGENNHLTEIHKAVVKRYNKLNDERGIAIKDFSSDEMLKEPNMTLSEFCMGLGEEIVKELNLFYHSKKEHTQAKNELGHNSLAIILGVPSEDISILPDNLKAKSLQNNPSLLNNIIEGILNIYKDINNMLKSSLGLENLSSGASYHPTIQTVQLLSFFASLWTTGYSIKDEELDVKKDKVTKGGTKEAYNDTLNKLVAVYIRDRYSNYWVGSANSKLNKFYDILDQSKNLQQATRSYSLEEITQDRLKEVLDNWYSDYIKDSSINFQQNTKILTVIFNGLLQKKKKAVSFQFEHILPKAKISRIYKKHKIAGSALGNTMLLDDSLNNRKKIKHLYQINIEDDERNEIMDGWFYPEESKIESLYKILDKEELTVEDVKVVKEFIKERGRNMIEVISKNIGTSIKEKTK